MKKLMALLLCMAMMAILFAACGGGVQNNNQDPGGDNNSEGGAGGAAEAGTATPAAAGSKPDGWTEADATESFSYHVSASITSLSKWEVSATNTMKVYSFCVFDPILNKDEDGNLIPWLAEEWEMADDYSHITFKLREDVYFTNGDRMTADDLIFSFERLRDDSEHYPDAIVKSWRDFIDHLVKIDEFNFELHFSQTMPEFWHQIADPTLQVINKRAYDEMGYDAFWQSPVGTGPYIVSSWDSANSVVQLTLRTDENGYWGYRYTDTYTNVKDITIQYSPEGQTRLASLRSGEVEMIDTIPTTDRDLLEGEGFHVQVMIPKNTVFLQTASAPGDIFDDPALCEALSLAIDRELIVETLLSGFGIAIEWPARPGDLGYEEGRSAVEYNPDRARELVEASDYNGEPIDFIFSTSTVNIGNELTQAIQSMAADVGINLEIRMLETAVYDEARQGHDFDLCLASIGDSGNMWYKIGAEVIGNDRFNTGYQNEELRALGKGLQTSMDQAEMHNLFVQIYEIETTDFTPNIYLYWPTIVNAWSPAVTGVKLHNDQMPDLSSLVIE